MLHLSSPGPGYGSLFGFKTPLIFYSLWKLLRFQVFVFPILFDTNGIDGSRSMGDEVSFLLVGILFGLVTHNDSFNE